MGILGTNSTEEDRLRQAAANTSSGDDASRRRSVGSTTGSSAYETADEDMESYEQQREYVNQPHADGYDEVADVTAGADDLETIQDHSAATNNILPEPETTSDVGIPSQGLPISDSNILTEDNSVHELVIEPNVLEARANDNSEDALNRRNTIERFASRLTLEAEGEAELYRELTRVSSRRNQVHIHDLTWDGPDDKDNPQNWPAWRKWFTTLSVASICLTVSLGSSLYTSGVEEMEIYFGASQTLVISGLTFYLIGLALGPTFTAPLSELIGRRWIYVFSLPISMLFTMGVGLSKNIESVLVLRFFCGLIASPALAVAGGSISDIWAPDQIGFAMAMFCLAPFLGPVLGPVVGNFAAQNKGWRWTMWVSLMFSGAILPFVLVLPETYKPIILAKRAKKRGIDLAVPEMNKEFFKATVLATLVKPMEMLVVEPIVSIFSIYIAFVFAVLFGFFEAFPIIFVSVYRMHQGVSGLPFISIGIGLILGVVFYIIVDKFYYFPKNPDGTRGKRDENGQMIWDAPETRLLFAKVGSVCMPAGLFWLGWSSRTSVHWIVPTISGAFFGFGLILVFFSTILYFSMSFPPLNVASALAANNFLRYITAGVFPLFTVQMYKRLGIDWASSLFAFIALALLPVPFVFGQWGPKFRATSKYGYASLFRKMAAEKEAAAAAAAAATEEGSAPVPNGDESVTSSNKGTVTEKGEELAPERDVSHKV